MTQSLFRILRCEAKILWDTVISMSSYMIERRPCCKLFYVCTGKWVGDQNLQAIIDSGTKEIEATGLFDDVIVSPNGANEIQKHRHKRPVLIYLSLKYSLYGPVRAWIRHLLSIASFPSNYDQAVTFFIPYIDTPLT